MFVGTRFEHGQGWLDPCISLNSDSTAVGFTCQPQLFSEASDSREFDRRARDGDVVPETQPSMPTDEQLDLPIVTSYFTTGLQSSPRKSHLRCSYLAKLEVSQDSRT